MELDPIAAVVPAPELATPGEGAFRLGADTVVVADEPAVGVASYLAGLYQVSGTPDPVSASERSGSS